jgi:hypothetical protein
MKNLNFPIVHPSFEGIEGTSLLSPCPFFYLTTEYLKVELTTETKHNDDIILFSKPSQTLSTTLTIVI